MKLEITIEKDGNVISYNIKKDGVVVMSGAAPKNIAYSAKLYPKQAIDAFLRRSIR